MRDRGFIDFLGGEIKKKCTELYPLCIVESGRKPVPLLMANWRELSNLEKNHESEVFTCETPLATLLYVCQEHLMGSSIVYYGIMFLTENIINKMPDVRTMIYRQNQIEG